MNHYQNELFSVSYPQRARYVVTEPNELRLFLPDESDEFIAVTIEYLPEAQDAHSAAQALYDQIPSITHHPTNLPPFSIQVGKWQGWRSRKQFFDGGQELEVHDHIHLQTEAGIFHFDLALFAENYEKYVWFLEEVVNTFALVQH